MKLSIVLLAGLALAGCLRNRSAAWRHWVLALAIICAGATPFVERAVPEWPLHLTVSRAMPTRVPDVSVAVAVTADAPIPSASWERVRPTDALTWLGTIWVAGAAIAIALLGVGMTRLAWLTSSAGEACERWTSIADQICREHALRRKPRLVQSDHPALLATWGVVRPRIVLPAAARTWPDDLVRVVLQHEIAHIRRWDWALQMAGELLRAVYWFNPLVWLASRRLRAESEQACDDDVLRSGVEPAVYAAHLLALARQFSRHRSWFPAPAMARRSTLHRRVAAMLNTRIDRRPLTLRGRLATLALLLAATVAVAAAQNSTTFSGTVVDPQGGVLPGVRVALTNTQRQTIQEVETNSAGQFQFAGLTAADYVVRVQLPGFQSYQATVSATSTNVVQTIALQLGQVHETINVVDAGETGEPTAQVAAARATPPCGQPPATGAVRIGGNLRPPVKIKDVAPAYPSSLRGTGATAEVVLDAVIGTDGFVHGVRPREGSQPEFAEALTTAVLQWQFDSTLLNCLPVEVPITIVGRFAPQR